MPRKGENITKRKDGRWEARLIYAYDENHRAMYRYLYGKTYGEAKAKKEYALSHLLLCRPDLPVCARTLEDVVEEFLFCKQTTVKPSTLSHYRYLFKTYIPPALAKQRMPQLTTARLERFAVELARAGGAQGGALSSKTVRDILALLRSLLKYAVKHRYATAELLDFDLPRAVSPVTEVFGVEEQATLERFLLDKPDSARLGVYLTLYTGLRLGEVCALCWSDIDFEKAELSVRRTVQRMAVSDPGSGHKTAVVIGTPKTQAGIRTIPLPSFLLTLLAERRPSEEEAVYLATGSRAYIEASNYYAKYRRWLRRLGIPPHSFHALRHTFATRCVERGFDVKSLSEILGHSDVRMTLNRYVHPSMDLKRRHMEMLGTPSP